MKPILLAIAAILLIVSIARFIQITEIVWNEVLTPARVFKLTWAPTLGVFVGTVMLGYFLRKK